jgi:hypothetical protein
VQNPATKGSRGNRLIRQFQTSQPSSHDQGDPQIEVCSRSVDLNISTGSVARGPSEMDSSLGDAHCASSSIAPTFLSSSSERRLQTDDDEFSSPAASHANAPSPFQQDQGKKQKKSNDKKKKRQKKKKQQKKIEKSIAKALKKSGVISQR